MSRTCVIGGREFQFVDETPHTAYVFDHLDVNDWEHDTFRTIDEYVKGGTFFDVGAWIGVFSIYAAAKAERIIALEPDPIALGMLERNLELNGVTNVEIVPKALWSSDGSTVLHQQGEWGDSMTGPTREGPGQVVETITVAGLQAMCGRPDLVKVDTEGSEGEFAAELVAWGCPVHLSVHEHELTKPLPLWDRPPMVHRSRPTNPYYSLVFHEARWWG